MHKLGYSQKLLSLIQKTFKAVLHILQLKTPSYIIK